MDSYAVTTLKNALLACNDNSKDFFVPLFIQLSLLSSIALRFTARNAKFDKNQKNIVLISI